MACSRILLLSVLLLLFTNIFSQDEEIRWGAEIKMPGSWQLIDKHASIIGSNENSYFISLADSEGEQIREYNYEHELLAEDRLADRFDHREVSVTNMINTPNGEYFLLKEERASKQNGASYLAKWENGALGELDEINFSVFSGPLAKGYEHYSDGSSNGQYTVICSTYEAHAGELTSFKVQLFDSLLSLQWESIWNVEEYQELDLTLSQLEVDDEGRVFILSNYTLDQREIPGKERSYVEDRQLLSYWPQGANSLISYKVALSGGNWPVEMGLIPVLEENELILTGFYRKDEKRSKRQEGVFQQTISLSDTKVLSEHFFPHEESVLGELLEKDSFNMPDLVISAMSRGRKGAYYKMGLDPKDVAHDNFTLRKLVKFGDGTISFLAESVHAYVSKEGNASYHAGRLLWVDFSPEKSEISPVIIQRDYLTSLANSMSCVELFRGEELYFIFNDNKTKTEVKQASAKGVDIARLTTDIVKLDIYNGDKERKSLINFEPKAAMFFRPVSSEKVKNGVLLLMLNKFYRTYKVGFLPLEQN